MKKLLIIFLVLMLIISFSLAKNVSVEFDYPSGTDFLGTINVSDDANAYTAITKIALDNNILLDLVYYDGLGYFVNGINGTYPEVSEYWAFFINDKYSLTDGMSTYVPLDGEKVGFAIVGFSYTPRDNTIDRAYKWLKNNQNPSGEFSNGATWGNAFSLMALSLTNDYQSEKNKAITYLISNQHDDSGFSYPGFDSDALHSGVSTLALTSNGYSLSEFDKNGLNTIDFIGTKQESEGGFSGFGTSDVDTTAWDILAYSSTSKSLPKKNNLNGIDYILSAQNSDGGFPYSSGQSSTIDYTSEAILALASQNHLKDSIITNALNYIQSQKNGNNCLTNSYTNSIAAIAFASYNEDNNTLLDCIEEEQLSDGGFGRNGTTSTSTDTALAIIALNGRTLPLTVIDFNSSDSNLIAVGDTIKFVLYITNDGNVSAKNVFITLQGIDPTWIKENVSDLFSSEIKPSETKQFEIFVDAKEVGNYNARAIVSASGITSDAFSNSQSFLVNSAILTLQLDLVK